MLVRIAEATGSPTSFFVSDAPDRFALNGSSDLVADLMVELGSRLMMLGESERAKEPVRD